MSSRDADDDQCTLFTPPCKSRTHVRRRSPSAGRRWINAAPFVVDEATSKSNPHATRPPVSPAIKLNSTASSRISARGRFSAQRGRGIGNIRPTGLGEPAALEAEPRHLLAQGAARNVEPLHHGADLAAGLLKAALDHGTLERLDLLRQ